MSEKDKDDPKFRRDSFWEITKLYANIGPKAHHRLVALPCFVKNGAACFAFEPCDQTSRVIEKAPALRVGPVFVDKADMTGVFVPQSFLAAPIQERPANTTVRQVFLGAVGFAAFGKVEGFVTGIGVEFRTAHWGLGHCGRGE